MTVRRLCLIVIPLLLGTVGCGIPLDERPQVIADGELPPALQRPEATSSTTATTAPSQLTEAVIIYLVDPAQARLVPVTRDVAVVDGGTDIERLAIEQLLLGPTEEEQIDSNLSTAVLPSGDAPLVVLDLERPVQGQLVVVLSGPPGIEGAERTTSFAQMVFTLTEFSEIDLVRFKVRDEDGVDNFILVKTDTDEGDVDRPVGRGDYSSLAPLSTDPLA